MYILEKLSNDFLHNSEIMAIKKKLYAALLLYVELDYWFINILSDSLLEYINGLGEKPSKSFIYYYIYTFQTFKHFLRTGIGIKQQQQQPTSLLHYV